MMIILQGRTLQMYLLIKLSGLSVVIERSRFRAHGLLFNSYTSSSRPRNGG